MAGFKMKTYSFNSQIQLGQSLPKFTDEQVKNEPMFWQADLKFAQENGGPITKAFLAALPAYMKRQPLVFDSRSHMLMPGWFPCIPGFHHDSVPRNTTTGQPNYDVENHVFHAIALINGDICPTEFAIGESEFPQVPDGEIIYKVWHNEVDKQLKSGILQSWKAISNRVIFMDGQTWHQGTKAVKNGWRWFGRASIFDDRTAKNEIRKQTTVYLEFPMEGW